MTKMKLNIAAHVACFGLSVAALFVGISEMRANAPVEVNVPKNSSVNAPSGLVDLTGAAESAVNSVVYIKVTQNTQIQQSVESRSPWGQSSATSRQKRFWLRRHHFFRWLYCYQ